MARRGLLSSKRISQHSSVKMIEPLELRRMLTTWVGGGVDAAGNIAYNTYFYTQPDATVMEARIGGDTTVEAIFYNGITDAIDPAATEGYLFQVYVARSDLNSVISIFPITTTGIAPFSSSGVSLQIDPNNPLPDEDPPTATAPAEVGAGILGAVTGTSTSATGTTPTTGTTTTSTSTGVPIIKENIGGEQIGVRPAGVDDLPDDPNNDLSAGLVVAPGLDLGKFLFGGEVFGKVDVPGNMNLFYAGWLLTGDARGASEGDGSTPVSLADGLPIPTGNFFVGGDLQNLATIGPIGWDGVYGGATPADEEGPHYLTGVDIEIGGKLGSINALDGDASSVHVLNDGAVPEPVEDQEELEGINSGGDFSSGELTQPVPDAADISPFENNDFLHAQFLGTFDTSLGTNTIAVDGTYDTATDVNTDPDDYYGVGLMAGQTITVQVEGSTGTRVGVFDPDGRLIATDYDKADDDLSSSNDITAGVADEPFQITATTAGEYRIAVSARGDVDFNNFADTSFELFETASYELTVTGAGNLAVGGIQTQGQSIETNTNWQKLDVDSGDVGGIYAAVNYHVVAGAEVLLNSASTNPDIPAPTNIGLPGIEVADGNLRSLVAGAIGLGLDTTGYSSVPYSAPDLDVPNGSVGRVQALTGILELNPNNLTLTDTGAPALAIGGDYEVVDGAPGITENMILGLVADGAIGTIDGPNLEDVPSVIIADADSKGDDGTIDLIDIADNLEDAYIWHGPGGDVRFMRVGGAVLNNPSFSTGYGERVVYNYNQTVTLTDDSGSTVTLTPLGQSIPNPVYNGTITDQTNIESVPEFGPRLTVATYPIASGGVCILDVASTGGLQVVGNANGVSGRAEISRIEVSGSALAPVELLDAATGVTSVRMPLTPTVVTSTTITTTSTTTGTLPDGSSGPITTTNTTPLTFNTVEETDVSITGSAITDVANIVVLGPSALGPADFPASAVNPVTALGNATSISNSTGGDIISVAALGIGMLTSNSTIGLGYTSIPGLALRFDSDFTVGTTLPGPRTASNGEGITNEMPVNPVSISPSVAGDNDAGSSFPFEQQTFGIAVAGDVVQISAQQGLGNIIVQGILGQVTADAGHNAPAGVFAGINGPIWAFGTNGSILNINIGQGILASGTGDVAFSGLYATDLIGTVTNNGNNSDIRGNIISDGRILSINLTNGSLINANVMILSRGTVTVGGFTGDELLATRQNSPFGGFTLPHTSTLSFHPTFDIQAINISGDGGIIGCFFLGYNMGNIDVTGFGIVNTEIEAPFDGRIASITAGGYGLRSDNIGGGASIGSINATGDGSELATTTLDPGVRESQMVQIDPDFAVAFDPFTGRILDAENDIDAALGTSAATPVIVGVTETGVIQDSDISDSTALGSITAQIIRAGQVGDTSDPTDPFSPANVNFSMQIDIGDAAGSITTRGVIDGLRLVAGTIKKFDPGSDVLGLNLTTSGKISNLAIKGSLAGNSIINAGGTNGGIKKISIAKDLVGTINVTNNVSSISVGGNLTGSLQIAGLNKGLALGKLSIGGSLLNGSLNVTGNVGTIQTSGSLGVTGDSLTLTGGLNKLLVSNGNLAAALTVQGKVGTIQVNGTILGTIIVGTVSGSFKSLLVNGAIDAPITINGKLQSAKINGNVNAPINAVDGITSFSITNGSLFANDTIESSLGSIDKLSITGGDLFGSVLAPGGTIKTIDVSNNLGDGIDALAITTTSLGTLSVGGSILSGVKVTVTGPLGTLIVGGSIVPGVTIAATSHRVLDVGGSIAAGTLEIG